MKQHFLVGIACAACICMAACKPHGNDIAINGGDTTTIFSLITSYHRRLGLDTVTYVSDHGDTAIWQLDVSTLYQPPVVPHFTAEGWSKDEIPEIYEVYARVTVLQGDDLTMPLYINIMVTQNDRRRLYWCIDFPKCFGYVQVIDFASSKESFVQYLTDSISLYEPTYVNGQQGPSIPDAALIVRNRGVVWFKQYAKGATAENPTVAATWYLQE